LSNLHDLAGTEGPENPAGFGSGVRKFVPSSEADSILPLSPSRHSRGGLSCSAAARLAHRLFHRGATPLSFVQTLTWRAFLCRRYAARYETETEGGFLITRARRNLPIFQRTNPSIGPRWEGIFEAKSAEETCCGSRTPRRLDWTHQPPPQFEVLSRRFGQEFRDLDHQCM